MDKVSACKQIVALVAINALAFFYDGQWINVAMVADFLMLGFDLKSIISKN